MLPRLSIHLIWNKINICFVDIGLDNEILKKIIGHPLDVIFKSIPWFLLKKSAVKPLEPEDLVVANSSTALWISSSVKGNS